MKKKEFNISKRRHTTPWYGWQRDRKDKRDLLYKVERNQEVILAEKLPALVDLSPQFPPAYDQGALGSCTSNAIAGAIQYIHKDLFPSRLFIYYNERLIEGTTEIDSGAQIRDGIHSVSSTGVCSEKYWAYNIKKFNRKPYFWCYWAATQDIITQYLSIVGLDEMKSCLAAGFPFVFGFTVFESFESDEVAKSGIATMPGPNERSVGGHAVLAVGYDDSTKMVKVRNSWGTDWGLNGYFYMPYSYISHPDLAADFWTIRTCS